MEDDLTQVTRVVKVPTGEGVLRPIRPIRDWLSLGQARGLGPTPTQVIEVVLAALRAIEAHGAPVVADAIWMDPDGRIELVLPSRGTCSEAACLVSMGMLVAELLAGSPAGAAAPEEAFSRARTRVLGTHPYEWTFPLELSLGRLLGLPMPYRSIREALEAFEHLAAHEGGGLQHLPAFGFPLGSPYHRVASQRPQFRWVLPAAVGFMAACALGAGAWLSYRMGQRQAAPPPAPAASQPAVPAGRIVMDPGTLAALAKALRDPAVPRSVTVPAPSTTKPPAPPSKAGPEPDEGPVFAGGPSPAALPRRQPGDPNRVTTNDFVARR